ncbi:hypothetical protein [Streptomyces chilikensis]|uniref:hypothetical protein n=1 Tax=Streptomyces chilikensis TaxID=1194079 RepID=UPI000AE9F125|nr:hypothetical protein [Streptomyces chilikensis]
MIKPGMFRATTLGVAALLFTGACTAHEGGSAATGAGEAPPPSGPQSTAAPDGSQEAVAAYKAMWDEAVEASHTANVKHPGLDDYATSGAHQFLLYLIRSYAKDGLVARGRPTFAPEVKSVTTDKVVISDCSDATRWLMYRKSDGQLEDDVPGGHHLIDATVGRHGDRWLVESLYVHEVGTCIT